MNRETCFKLMALVGLNYEESLALFHNEMAEMDEPQRQAFLANPSNLKKGEQNEVGENLER